MAAIWTPASYCDSFKKLKRRWQHRLRLLDLLRHLSRRSIENKANQREPEDYLGHGWGFSWPNDVRILYNRCSARPDGKPWSERKKLVWWDEEKRSGPGSTCPTSTRRSRPITGRQPGAKGMDAHRRRQAVHPASRRRRLAVRDQRAEGRSAAHALRAAGVAIPKSTLSRAHLPILPPTGRSGPTIPTPSSPMSASRTCSPPIA